MQAFGVVSCQCGVASSVIRQSQAQRPRRIIVEQSAGNRKSSTRIRQEEKIVRLMFADSDGINGGWDCEASDPSPSGPFGIVADRSRRHLRSSLLTLTQTEPDLTDVPDDYKV